MNKRQYTSNWVYGNSKVKKEMAEELAAKAIWSNDNYCSNIPQSVKVEVCKHILSTNSEWAYTLYCESTHVYLHDDCSCHIGVYGLHIGDIKFPKCETITCEITGFHNDWEINYYGDYVNVSNFSVK